VREHGTVIDVRDGRALVEVTPAEGCGKTCSSCAVAGSPHLRRVELDAPDGLRPGSGVTLEVGSGRLVTSSAVVFLGPPACFVLGAVLSQPLLRALGVHINPDLGMILIGGLAFFLALAAAILFSRRAAKRHWLTPRIVDVDRAAPSSPLPQGRT